MLFKIIYLGLAWCSTSVFQTEIFFLCRYAFLVPLLCSCECGAVVVPFRQERSLVLVKNLNDMALGGGACSSEIWMPPPTTVPATVPV